MPVAALSWIGDDRICAHLSEDLKSYYFDPFDTFSVSVEPETATGFQVVNLWRSALSGRRLLYVSQNPAEATPFRVDWDSTPMQRRLLRQRFNKTECQILSASRDLVRLLLPPSALRATPDHPITREDLAP